MMTERGFDEGISKLNDGSRIEDDEGG